MYTFKKHAYIILHAYNGPIIQLNDSIQLWVIETLLSILLGELSLRHGISIQKHLQVICKLQLSRMIILNIILQ